MSAKNSLVYLVPVCFALLLVVGCTAAGGFTADDPAEIREELLKPHTPKEREAILKPRALSSIGEMAKISGLEPEPVIGFGLVTGLGTRGGDKGGIKPEIRHEILKNLFREEERSPEERGAMLASRDSSIVRVSGMIPPAAARADTFDVVVVPLDTAISLEGGHLHITPLTVYAESGGKKVRGDAVARARGPLITGRAEEETVVIAAGNPRYGVVFDGGLFEADRILFVRLEEKHASANRTALIEYLLNRRLANVGRRSGDSPVRYALALTSRTVSLTVPPAYRKFVDRFADVVRAIKGSHFYGPPSSQVLDELADRLENGAPQAKYAASVELEAVGPPAIPYLEKALGDDHTKLYSGQALSYLNANLGRTRIIAASESPIEQVRFEAVKFLTQLAGRDVIQATRARVFDESRRVSIEAVNGLIAMGPDYGVRSRWFDFDLVALKAVSPGLIVKSTGRAMIVVTGIGTALKGDVLLRLDTIVVVSGDDDTILVITGPAKTTTVAASVDNLLAVLTRENVPFATLKKAIAALEDAGNIPYKITWMD